MLHCVCVFLCLFSVIPPCSFSRNSDYIGHSWRLLARRRMQRGRWGAHRVLLARALGGACNAVAGGSGSCLRVRSGAFIGLHDGDVL
jgi:hypothetical protein